MFVSRYYYLNIINQNILYMWFLNVLAIVTLRNHLYVTKSKGENCQQIIFSFRYKVIILSCLANFTLCLFVVGKLQTSDILTILLMKYSFAQTCRFSIILKDYLYLNNMIWQQYSRCNRYQLLWWQWCFSWLCLTRAARHVIQQLIVSQTSPSLILQSLVHPSWWSV